MGKKDKEESLKESAKYGKKCAKTKKNISCEVDEAQILGEITGKPMRVEPIEETSTWETDVIAQDNLKIPARSKLVLMGTEENCGRKNLIREPAEVGNSYVI